jgi:hypothetical protein
VTAVHVLDPLTDPRWDDFVARHPGASVFHILGQHSTRLWREQIERILAENGLASFIAHPDYLVEPAAQWLYTELLRLLVSLREERGVWFALPSEIDGWWRDRRGMRLVPDGSSWRIEGRGSDRARLAFARLRDGRVVYELAGDGGRPFRVDANA